METQRTAQAWPGEATEPCRRCPDYLKTRMNPRIGLDTVRPAGCRPLWRMHPDLFILF